ncbi:MAG: hypothetical protein HY543_06130 [Deltaproteobacteria bacterium]|nr:hypothetical protein [Deltaproteobacteria bacterium]
MNPRGNALVVVLLLLPFFAALIVFVADLAHRMATKLALQIAADRAAYAGAAHLAETLNAIAGKNWRIRQRFLAAQKKLAARSTEQSAAVGRYDIAEAQADIDALREAMDELNRDGYRGACEAALAAARQWAPRAALRSMYGAAVVLGDAAGAHCEADAPLFSFGKDMVEPEEQWPDLAFVWTEGNFVDPHGRDGADDRLLQYRRKAPVQGAADNGAEVAHQVAFAVRLEEPAPASGLSDLFGEGPLLRAAAAAQPYGGSIQAAAFWDAPTEEEAVARMPYRPTLVPLEQLRDGDAGYLGLRYWDDNAWIDDDHMYLH